MTANEVCMVLGINKHQLSYLVRRGKIANQGDRKEANYSDEDVKYLARQRGLVQGNKLTKVRTRTIAFSNERIESARRELIIALREACLTSGLPRDVAEGRLSLFTCDLYDEIAPVTWKLPSSL